MATLQDIIASIPTAQDGAVISIDYHNTMLAAIKLLAAQGGGGSSGGPATINLSFAPQFAANDGSPAWSLQSGIASKPGGTATQAIGWMNLQLPDGYVIDHMVISGNKTGNVGSFNATLLQQPLTSTGLVAVLAATLDTAATDSTGNFSVTARATSIAIIGNTQSKYILQARIVGADAGATASVYGIQVVCTQVINTGGGFGIQIG
jgi:hypothetical protein